ncbi:hypothetical protein [Rhizobium sp. CSW-27]|uniref:hypothetical protein n=1 Tax=Rhizobium sp. CSW-27 TaxID=2839985 RepID=UPI001C00B749|nr:hypothetical protein [Rhizobium sp. CSW-27]MBT9373277.1 hypothetical protein [Rhizobium sp. CSW-27]
MEAKNPRLNEEPAEGSRETVERQLRRQDEKAAEAARRPDGETEAADRDDPPAPGAAPGKP